MYRVNHKKRTISKSEYIHNLTTFQDFLVSSLWVNLYNRCNTKIRINIEMKLLQTHGGFVKLLHILNIILGPKTLFRKIVSLILILALTT